MEKIDIESLTEDNEILTTVIIGLAISVLLAFIMEDFYSWFVDNIIGYVGAIFLVVPLANTIMQRKLPNTFIFFIIMGTAILIIQLFILNMTTTELVITILQTIVVVVLIESTVLYFRNVLEKEISDYDWRKIDWK